jgi:hypothetical protein
MELDGGCSFDGFDLLAQQLQTDNADGFLIQDEESPAAGPTSSVTHDVVHDQDTGSKDAEPPFAMGTLNFVVLYAKYEREFFERTKAALGTEYLPYSVREEMATNAFLAARCAMALEATGTPRTSNAVFTPGMTPEQKEQATEEALTPEDHLRAHFDTRTYFDTLLPDRLALMASLAFS